MLDATDPGDGALHDPALGYRLEALGGIRALDDLDRPRGAGHGFAQLVAAIGAVGEDLLEEGKQPAGAAIQHQDGAIAVLQVGCMHGDIEDQADGVDEQVALLALDLLARVIARAVDARPPFSAPFTLWLSITPALGDASRPSSSRVIKYSAW